MTGTSPEFPGEQWTALDTGVAHTARVWNYWLGGKDNYAADRQVGEQIREVIPDIITSARADRAFLGRAVRYLVADAGIRQFLDLGTGLPTAGNTHEVAQELAPESRIVYVDNDPLVLIHARALLNGTPEGATDYIEADARNTEQVVQAASRTLDLGRPVGLMLLGILNFITDDDEAVEIIDRLVAAVPSGSHLAIAHPTSEVNTEAALESLRLWNEHGEPKICFRSREELIRLFDGLELLEPGVVSCSLWRPEAGETPAPVYQFCGLARKP
nr:SAM-dependent methyltransferase [Rhizohabitans arisaemae]